MKAEFFNTKKVSEHRSWLGFSLDVNCAFDNFRLPSANKTELYATKSMNPEQLEREKTNKTNNGKTVRRVDYIWN